MQGTVRAIFIKPQKGSKSISLESVKAVEGGFDGDHHTGSSQRRQILMVSGSTLDELNLSSGSVYENVVVDGMDVMALKDGQRLRLGTALVAATLECDPCIQMERVRHGLQVALEHRRGMFVKVLSPGMVRIGDRVEVLWQESAVENSAR